eukprot:269676-Pyramimonas_sp.AAC.1
MSSSGKSVCRCRARGGWASRSIIPARARRRTSAGRPRSGSTRADRCGLPPPPLKSRAAPSDLRG